MPPAAAQHPLAGPFGQPHTGAALKHATAPSPRQGATAARPSETLPSACARRAQVNRQPQLALEVPLLEVPPDGADLPERRPLHPGERKVEVRDDAVPGDGVVAVVGGGGAARHVLPVAPPPAPARVALGVGVGGVGGAGPGLQGRGPVGADRPHGIAEGRQLGHCSALDKAGEGIFLAHQLRFC